MVYYILKSYKLNFDPLRIFEIFSRQKNCFFLDSSLSGYPSGRFSFLGIEPFSILEAKQKEPFDDLRDKLSLYKIPIGARHALPCIDNIPFFGGAVGYLAYDLGFALEKKIKSRVKPDLGIPDSYFAFYNTVVIIDHYKNLFYILALGWPEKKGYLSRALAEENFKKIYKLICNYTDSVSQVHSKSPHFPPLKKGGLRGDFNFTKQQYIQAVKKVKEYIKQGDIYQLNLSQHFKANSKMPAWEIYTRLRRISPACFNAYFDAGEFQIISSSPERFVSLNRDMVVTQPMKGTRPRAQNKIKDAALKNELLKSAKDKAELMMIVDLERNDLGKVCDYSSVRVEPLRQLERYSTVFQTTATVTGKLHKNKDRFDLLRACFPGGSITGCPKIRAMEIIDQLEPVKRSIYTGALGYLSFSGDMDFNILIRTILKKQDELYFGAGGGIVADSDPEDEYNETLVKAKGMLEAINAKIEYERGML
ncbi:MAG: aminodeoxychorismate synthase component I [Candidatus Omnitrophota bacterium]